MSDRSGDAGEALAAVYDACADDLYRYALMILADHAGAEDAVQQAFAKLVKMGIRTFEIESYDGYLRTAVRHECYRIMQQRRRNAAVELGSARRMLEPVCSQGIDEDERATVEAALRALPADQREVVHLKVYEELTFRQIADLLAISANTAASRYRYALEKLRRLLG